MNQYIKAIRATLPDIAQKDFFSAEIIARALDHLEAKVGDLESVSSGWRKRVYDQCNPEYSEGYDSARQSCADVIDEILN